MKASRYNIIVKHDNGYLLFNSLSGNLVKISNVQYGTYRSCFLEHTSSVLCDSDKITSEFIGGLEKGRFIVADDLDELEKVKMIHYNQRFSRNNFNITISPTSDCNFNCRYCYQSEKPPVYMTRETENSIARYIEAYLSAAPSIMSICLNWFGGEVTLALDTVYRLSGMIKEIAEAKKLIYTSTFTSNGYILNKKIAAELKKCKISCIMVTLDGPSGIHDKRRFLKSGGGTFDTILKNIINTSDIMKFVIVCMVDKENINHIPRLIDILEKQGLAKCALVGFSRTVAFPGTCESVKSTGLSEPEYAKLVNGWYSDLLRRGFGISKSIPVPNLQNCFALGPDMIGFDAEGYMYRCNKTIWDRKETIGHVSEPPKFNNNYNKWMAWDPFKEGQCSSCRILPLCMGGCPYISIQEGVPELHGTQCPTWKYNMEDTVKIMYESERRPEYESIQV